MLSVIFPFPDCIGNQVAISIWHFLYIRKMNPHALHRVLCKGMRRSFEKNSIYIQHFIILLFSSFQFRTKHFIFLRISVFTKKKKRLRECLKVQIIARPYVPENVVRAADHLVACTFSSPLIGYLSFQHMYQPDGEIREARLCYEAQVEITERPSGD